MPLDFWTLFQMHKVFWEKYAKEIREEMSQINAEIGCGKREIKLTSKAMANKIEKLQQERKNIVHKIKRLIPEMKTLMRTKENVTTVQLHTDNLYQLYENATTLHNMLLPLLPEDEQIKQDEWFSNIMRYSDTFRENVNKWMSETVESLHNDSPDQSGQAVTTGVCISDIHNSQTAVQAVSIIMAYDPLDEVKPSDSVSNVGRGARSQVLWLEENQLFQPLLQFVSKLKLTWQHLWRDKKY